MTLVMLDRALLVCTAIDFGILLLWALMLLVAHDFVYRLHTRWFKLTVSQFDAIHYGGMAFFKLLWLMFNVVPWVAIKIIQ